MNRKKSVAVASGALIFGVGLCWLLSLSERTPVSTPMIGIASTHALDPGDLQPFAGEVAFPPIRINMPRHASPDPLHHKMNEIEAMKGRSLHLLAE